MSVSLGQVINQRNYQRARHRALVRLSHLFQEEYKQLLKEERANDEAMGKTWVGIDLTTGNAITLEQQRSAVAGDTYTSNDGENQSNYGGEE